MKWIALFKQFPRPVRWGLGGVAAATLIWLGWPNKSAGSGDSKASASATGDGSSPVIAVAAVKPFVQEVVEKGEIMSSSNVEVRCQVQSKSTGSLILSLIPEGTTVKEGDTLAKLDDSAWQAELVTQQIAFNASKSTVVEAEVALKAAQIALTEYESGTFRQEEQTIESEEFVAREDLRRAEEYYRYSQKLAARGYVTEVQLQADAFAVEKARKTLASAQTKLRVLREFTKSKMLNQLRAAVETAESKVLTQKSSHMLDEQKLENIKRQIANCVVKAPAGGQVVYSRDGEDDENAQPPISEGRMVRERQVMFRLPDSSKMKVTARVNEANIDRVKTGMKTKIKVDALPGLELQGLVAKVSEYPLPRDWWNSLKEYAADIEIVNPPEMLRPGMSAQVSVEIQKLPEALQVPVQAVLAEGKQRFLLIPSDDEDEAPSVREVELGPANETSVVIKSGIKASETVLLAPHNYTDRVTLPIKVSSPPAAGSTKPVLSNSAAKVGA